MTKETVKDTPVLIWDKIKSIDLELFALKDQFVEKHVTPVIDMSKDGELWLIIKTQAALPQLELVLSAVKSPSGRSFEVEQKDKFTIVKVSNY